MKFISKSANLLIVLRPGLSAQPLTGTPAKATISVRFKDGIVDVQDQELIDMMLKHPGFNGDFISAETDPYALSRQSVEPAHVLTEMKYGTPVSRKIEGGASILSPEIQKLVNEMAIEMAKKILPSMVEGTLKTIVEANEAKKASDECIKTVVDLAGQIVPPKTAPKSIKKNKRKSKKRIRKAIPENAMQTAPVEPVNPLVQESVS